MQKDNEEIVLTFSNVYEEKRWKDSIIDDLAYFKADEVDNEMQFIKDDIIDNLNDYFLIEKNKSSFTYQHKEMIVGGDDYFNYKVSNIDVNFHEHYAYEAYKDAHLSVPEMGMAYLVQLEDDKSYFDKSATAIKFYEDIENDIVVEVLDLEDDDFLVDDKVNKFCADMENYIKDTENHFVSSYYYEVHVTIKLSRL